ncbi:hypothetical protein BMS3Abin03_01117 [bacterium BMS3Abin03]|nr:hypothetical protein BMS3Abin03_01117 [bacterium BMS3Abin03]
MALDIRRADYYYTSVEDQPGEAYKLLSQLADIGVNLLAFTAIPVGPMRTQFTLFPEDSNKLIEAARKAGFTIDGPNPALLVQGDDELGALTGIHKKLYQAGVNVYASSGVTDGQGSFGYVLYIRPEEMNKAVSALEVS